MRIDQSTDDYGLQNYKIQKKAEGEIRQPDHVEPFPRIGDSGERHEKPSREPEPRDRRKGDDRRQGERRQQQEETPLDTRSGEDRRKENRRDEDRDDGPPHIDVTV